MDVNKAVSWVSSSPSVIELQLAEYLDACSRAELRRKEAVEAQDVADSWLSNAVVGPVINAILSGNDRDSVAEGLRSGKSAFTLRQASL